MRILVLGDTHAVSWAVQGAANFAADNGIDGIFQVGDFGFWPRSAAERGFLESTALIMETCGIKLWWLPGNHEDWETYLELIARVEPDEHGFYSIDEGGRVLAAPPTHTWEWDGMKFGSAGGAYSIDRQFREEGVSWFKEEVPDWDYPKAFDDDIDVMLSHDAPINIARANGWVTNFQIAEPDLAEQSNVVIYNCLQMAQPGLAVHGHWHWWGIYPIEYMDDTAGTVVGLDRADGPPLTRCAIVLDTEARAAYTIDQYLYEGDPLWQAS